MTKGKIGAIICSETRTRKEVNRLFDYEELRKKIKQVCGTQEIFAKKMGIGRVSLNLRLNNKAEFSQAEIHKACDVLGLSRDDIPKYFFKPKVQKHELA